MSSEWRRAVRPSRLGTAAAPTIVAGMPNQATAASGEVVEKFASSGGRLLGFVSVSLLLVVAVGSAVSDPVGNQDVVLASLAAALLGWVTLIRPVAVAHSKGLLLRNMTRDTLIPWSRIERCVVHQTLQVVTPEGRFHGLGISRSTRSMMKGDKVTSSMQMRGAGLLGMGGAAGIGGSANPSRRANEEASGGNYTDYISGRILNLARSGTHVDGETVVAWDPVAVAAVVAAAACLGLIFL